MDYHSPALPWTLDSLNFADIDIARVRHNEDLFFLLCGASFVESGSDLYTHNLIEHFDGDPEFQSWLRDHWEHEEMQHGSALTAYVRHVWPEFDWDAGFQAFWNDYGTLCTSEQLEPSRGLELAARCVVETGTASLYRALNDMADEPVLKQLTNNIKSDEVRHYKHFYHAFLRYREQEQLGRYKVFRALLRRANNIRSEDSDIALRHVFNQCYPQHKDDKAQLQKVTAPALALLRRHVPAEMGVKMLLKPLSLPPRLQQWLEKPLARITDRLFLN